MKKYFALFLLLPLLVLAQSQGVLTRFSPANGILVGTRNSPTTTAATSADVRALWSGTCNSSSFLRGDGSCQSISTTSAANPTASVGLSAVNGVASTYMRSDAAPVLSQAIVPTWTGVHTFDAVPAFNGGASGVTAPFSVDSTFVVSSLNADLLDGNSSSAFATASHNHAASDVNSGTFTVARGGTGVATLTGIAKGNGTSAFTAATSSDVIGLWTGTCNSSTYLRADGSCVASTGPSPGNSVNQVALGSSAGVSTDYMRADAQLALNQAILPTWTGQHTFNAIPIFNGGTSGSTAPFTVDSTFVVTNLNADTVDGQSASAFAAASHAHSAADVTSGTLAVARGGTGTTTSTGTGNVVLSASPTFTGTVAMAAATVGGSNVCRADGTNCPAASGPRHAYGYIAADGSGCSLFSSYANAGIASCTRTGTGAYSVNFSPAFSNVPLCVYSPTSDSTLIPTLNTGSTSLNSVVVKNTSGTATDGSFSIQCLGT